MNKLITLTAACAAGFLIFSLPVQGHAHGTGEKHTHGQETATDTTIDESLYLEENEQAEEAKEESRIERRKRKRKELRERMKHAKEHRRERRRPTSSRDTHHH